MRWIVSNIFLISFNNFINNAFWIKWKKSNVIFYLPKVRIKGKVENLSVDTGL